MLENKIGMIFGVANKRSMPGRAPRPPRNTGQSWRSPIRVNDLKENVEKLAGELNDSLIVPCDVTNSEQVDAAFDAVKEKYGRLDFLIHSIAFAPREALEGEFLATTPRSIHDRLRDQRVFADAGRNGCVAADDRGGSIVTMSYYGAEKVVHELQRDGRRQSGP